LQLACETHQHTIHSVLLQSLSVFSYVLVYFLLSELGFADTLAKTFTQIWVTPLFYFLIVTLTLWVILFEKLTYHWSLFIEKLALKRKQAVQKANVAKAIKANSEKK